MESAGKVNVYTCPKCKAEHVTINAVEGTTPFMMRCRGFCRRDMATSAFYRCDQDRRPAWEWYRPDASDPAMADDSTRQHVEMGGLILRRVTHETLERFGFGLRTG